MNPTSSPSRIQPFKPAPFGRYVLLAPIASGGMGQVFLAKARGVEGFEKLCVIKKILPAFAKDPEFVGRFVDEAKILVKLTHGSIAQVFDMGEVDEDYYIAIEFVDGKDLRQIVSRQRERNQPMDPALASYILTRVLDALAYAHRKTDPGDQPLGLVHRDVSPQNILLSYEGEVKVIDFGLAKVATGTRRTSPSVVMGKFYYMAPEQATHIDVDKRVDLYAAGMMLYELLAGRHPLEGTPAHLVFERLTNPNIPPLQRLAPGVPTPLCEAVDKALAVDPDQRYASAEEFRGRLQGVQLQIDPGCGPESLSRYMREAFAVEYARERPVIAGLSAASIQPEQDVPQHTRSFLVTPAPDSSSSETVVKAASSIAPPARSSSGRHPRSEATAKATADELFAASGDDAWGSRIDVSASGTQTTVDQPALRFDPPAPATKAMEPVVVQEVTTSPDLEEPAIQPRRSIVPWIAAGVLVAAGAAATVLFVRGRGADPAAAPVAPLAAPSPAPERAAATPPPRPAPSPPPAEPRSKERLALPAPTPTPAPTRTPSRETQRENQRETQREKRERRERGHKSAASAQKPAAPVLDRPTLEAEYGALSRRYQQLYDIHREKLGPVIDSKKILDRHYQDYISSPGKYGELQLYIDSVNGDLNRFESTHK